MVALKSANRTNKGNVYGFLPENNEEYLKDFDDRKLAEFCRGMTPLEENSPYVGEWILDTEKTNEMNEYSLFDAFGSALTEYGNGMELKEDGTFTYYMGAGNGGQGTWKMNDKAIKYSITQYESNRKVNGQLITESDWLVMKDYFDDGEGYDMYWKRDGGQ